MKKIYTLLFLLLLVFAGNKAFSQSGLKINEFDYDQPGSDSAEFIELYNSSLNAIDLGGYAIVLINGNGNTPYDTIILPSHLLNPSEFYVICGSFNFVPNSNLVLAVPSNIVQNGSPDAMAIIDIGAASIVDAVSYEGTVASPFYETAGVPAGATSSDSSLFSFVGLSRFPDGQDSNNNSADFQLVCITPGTANVNATSNCSQPLLVSAIDDPKQLKIYPNPSRGISIIDFNGASSKNTTITLHNVLGKELKKAMMSGNEVAYSLDLTEYPNGIYFVKVKSENSETTHRIVLRK